MKALCSALLVVLAGCSPSLTHATLPAGPGNGEGSMLVAPGTTGSPIKHVVIIVQ